MQDRFAPAQNGFQHFRLRRALVELKPARFTQVENGRRSLGAQLMRQLAVATQLTPYLWGIVFSGFSLLARPACSWSRKAWAGSTLASSAAALPTPPSRNMPTGIWRIWTLPASTQGRALSQNAVQ
jgi:hypothetical protein